MSTPADGLTPERQALAADPRAIGYALALARGYARRTNPRLADEFEGAALLGLVKAAASYDSARGADFRKTWLPHHVKGAVLRAHQKWMPKGYRRGGKYRVGMPEVVNMDTEAKNPGEVTWDQIPAAEDPVGWDLEYEDLVRSQARGLAPRYAEALLLYHLRAGTTMEGIAAAMGLSPTRVQQMIEKAHRRAGRRAA